MLLIPVARQNLNTRLDCISHLIALCISAYILTLYGQMDCAQKIKCIKNSSIRPICTRLRNTLWVWDIPNTRPAVREYFGNAVWYYKMKSFLQNQQVRQRLTRYRTLLRINSFVFLNKDFDVSQHNMHGWQFFTLVWSFAGLESCQEHFMDSKVCNPAASIPLLPALLMPFDQ